MKYLKLGLISIVVFGVLLQLISLMLPSRVRISRAINVNAAEPVVRQFLTDATTWPKWNELSTGAGELRLHGIADGLIMASWGKDGRRLDAAIRLESSANITVVQWYFDLQVGWYPWRKFASVSYDAQFGPPMERSLNRMRQLVEAEP